MSQTSWLTATVRPGATCGYSAGTQVRPPRHPMVHPSTLVTLWREITKRDRNRLHAIVHAV